MKRWFTWAALTVLGLAPQAAEAQFTGGYPPTARPPSVSPYLQLDRTGRTGIDYFTRVRPQMQAYQQFQDLSLGLNRLSGGGAGTDDPAGAPAGGGGMPMYFGNYMHYFPAMPAPQVNPLMPTRR